MTNFTIFNQLTAMPKRLAMVLTVLFTIGVGSIWGETATLTFTAACNGSGTDDEKNSWTITSDGAESSFDNTKGIHYGTNSAKVQYIKLSTSDISGTITSVKVNASTASGVTATVAVKVGTSNFTRNNQTTATLSTTATDYTFTGSASGDILVTITKASSAAKALYCKSVEVVYTPSGGGNTGGDSGDGGGDVVDGTWTLVTDATTLKAGDQIVIASNTKGFVAGAITTDYMANSSAVTFSADKSSITTLPNDAEILTLGGTSGAWTLTNEEDKQLGATAVKKVAWDSGTKTWSISISNNGDATIQNGTSSYGRFLHNVSSTRFTTYTSNTSSSMLLPQIYKNTSSAEPTQLSAPTRLRATNVTHNSATLSWDAVNHATGYKVNINNNTYQVNSGTSQLVVTGLDPGKSYGWSVTAIGDETTYTNSKPATSDVMTKPVYTVNYDLNGGEGTTPTETEKAEGEQFTLATADKITKSGYSFSGWNDGTNTYAAGATYTMPAKEVTFKAQWSALPKLPTPTDLEVTNKTSTSATFSWTVNENASSYSLTINNQTYHVTKSNIPYKVTGLTKNSSYGWSVQAIGDGKTYSNSDKATSNVITLNSYTVTFNANGHGTAPESQTVDHGGKATRPDNPTANGVSFVGWYTESACTTQSQFNFSTMTIESDITLYAKWNVATYTVNWYIGGDLRKTETYNHNASLQIPTMDLNCGGATPIGWSEKETYEHATDAPSGFFSTASGTVTANKNYYAVFADVNGSGGGTAWTETAIGDIEATDDVVITMTNGTITWALTNGNGTSKAPAANTATITNNAITSAIPSDLIWNISNDGNGNLTIYPNGTTTTWLYCINDNNGVRVGTNANKTFFISGNYLVNIATTRYVGVYTTNPDWRCYTNTTGNIANQTLKFYKKSSGGTTYTNYTTECTNAPKLDAPTDLNVSDLSCSSVTLSWTTVANASGYEVVRTLNAHNTTYTTDEPSITIEGLTGGNENSWKVRAMGDGVNHGNSDYTTGDNFTTLFSVKYYVDEALWHGCDNGCAANGGSFEICETTPTKANYDFAGWATSVGGEVAYQAGEVINNIAANITLHAVWALSNHTVNWSVNGQDNKVTYPHGQDLALPSISITPCVDMEHIGWTNEMVYVHNTDLLFTEAEGTVTSDTAFYAVFATPHTSTGEPTTTTLDFTARGYSNEEDITSATEGAIKVTFDKGTNSNAPKYYNNGTAIRIYGGGYFTVSSENTISKITITFGSSDGTNAITTDCGTYYNGTWTGSAKSIKFTIGGTSGNRRIQKLAVTSAGTSKYHNGHTTTCDIKTIANPTNLKATYITYNGATLTWEEVGARTYSISIDGKTYETNHNAITITGLKEKTTYTWSVQAKGNGSNYLHSDIVNGPSFTTGTALELTWSVSAKKHHTTITLGQPIGKLPSYPVPNGCAGKYFIGWTTTNSINNDGTGITYITSDETPLVPTTYYAVYATPEGNAAGAELFQESFTANDGTGGNDDKWSGGIASSKLDSYGNWEELQYVYKGYQCIKLGTGSGLGKITTPALGINGSATLTFKAGAWNGSDEKLNILVTIVGNGSIEPSSFTLTKGEFNDYNANITGADENTKVTFAATNNSDNRFFLDEVIVTDGSSITYTDYTTSCGDFLVTFYGFTGGYSTTCDGNPAEIAVPQGSDYIIPNCTPATDPQGLGRTFAGTWNTKANGSGTSYAPGATIEYVNDNITLYAQWTMATSGNTTLPTDESGIADLANTDVIVYGGNTLTLAEGTTTIKSLTLKGGIQKDKSYAMPVVKIPDNATLVRKDNKINLDLKINNQNFYPFAVPFEVANTAANINYINTTLKEYVNAHNGYGKFYVIREYNGALRAENGANKDENWVHVGRSDVKLLPGKGYIISAVPAAGTDTVTIRITMTVDNKWLANGEQTSITSGSNTITRNQVGVTAYTGPAATNDPCNAGWNFVANPYLTNFAGASMKDDNDQDLDYIKGEIIVNNGHFEHDGREIPYVTIPASDFGWYDQYRVSDVKLSPMWSFFVQIGTDGTMNFTTAGRQQAPAALRANAAAENPRIEANLAILYGEQKADHTGLIIDDRYTSDYEIGADLEKMFGSAYNTTIYTLSNSTRLAYNAVPHQLAQQSIPLGFRAAEEGDYTISLTNYEEITGVESIILHDLYTNEKTNLLHLDYNFYTDQTQDDNRFVVYLVPRDNTATDISTIIDEAQQSENRKVLINNHLYIIHNGKVYNGAGQIVK